MTTPDWTKACRVNRRVVVTSFVAAAATSLSNRALGAGVSVDVKMPASGMIFSPAVVHVAVGDTVRWTNLGIVTHTVTFDPAAARTPGLVVLPPGVQPFDSGSLEQDDSFSHVFTVEGAYGYICRYHQSSGMVGKVIVS